MTLQLAKTCKVLLMGTDHNEFVTISSLTKFKKSAECKDAQTINIYPCVKEEEKKLPANTIIDDQGRIRTLETGTKIRFVRSTLVIINDEKNTHGFVHDILDVEIC